MLYPLGEQRDLDLGLAGVGLAVAELLDQLCLRSLVKDIRRLRLTELCRSTTLVTQLARASDIAVHLLD